MARQKRSLSDRIIGFISNRSRDTSSERQPLIRSESAGEHKVSGGGSRTFGPDTAGRYGNSPAGRPQSRDRSIKNLVKDGIGQVKKDFKNGLEKLDNITAWQKLPADEQRRAKLKASISRPLEPKNEGPSHPEPRRYDDGPSWRDNPGYPVCLVPPAKAEPEPKPKLRTVPQEKPKPRRYDDGPSWRDNPGYPICLVPPAKAEPEPKPKLRTVPEAKALLHYGNPHLSTPVFLDEELHPMPPPLRISTRRTSPPSPSVYSQATRFRTPSPRDELGLRPVRDFTREEIENGPSLLDMPEFNMVPLNTAICHVCNISAVLADGCICKVCLPDDPDEQKRQAEELNKVTVEQYNRDKERWERNWLEHREMMKRRDEEEQRQIRDWEFKRQYEQQAAALAEMSKPRIPDPKPKEKPRGRSAQPVAHDGVIRGRRANSKGGCNPTSPPPPTRHNAGRPRADSSRAADPVTRERSKQEDRQPRERKHREKREHRKDRDDTRENRKHRDDSREHKKDRDNTREHKKHRDDSRENKKHRDDSRRRR